MQITDFSQLNQHLAQSIAAVLVEDSDLIFALLSSHKPFA